MKRVFILTLLFAALAVGAVFALKQMQPGAFENLMLSFDMSPQSKEEKARLDRIRLLPIAEEKKKILSNRTIFLGASTKMAELALGKPIQSYEYPDHTPRVDRWVYYFADDSRPTVLEFEDNKLSKAYKVSAHRLNLSNAVPSGQPPAQR